MRDPHGHKPTFATWRGVLAHAILFHQGSLDYLHTHVWNPGAIYCTSALGATKVTGSSTAPGQLKVGVLLPGARSLAHVPDHLHQWPCPHRPVHATRQLKRTDANRPDPQRAKPPTPDAHAILAQAGPTRTLALVHCKDPETVKAVAAGAADHASYSWDGDPDFLAALDPGSQQDWVRAALDQPTTTDT